MKINSSIILIFCILAVETTQAQKTAIPSETHKVLADIAQYNNDLMHFLWMESLRLHSFNTSCISYLRSNRYHFSYDSVDYLKPNVFNYYDELPSKQYQKILPRLNHLPVPTQNKITEVLGSMQTVINEIHKIDRELYSYVNSSVYKEDRGMSKGAIHLQRVSILYYDMKALKDRLDWAIQDTYSEYTRPDSNNPYIRSANAFMPAMNVLQRSIDDTRKQDMSNIGRYKEELNSYVKSLEEHKEEYLFGVPVLSKNNGFSAQGRFDNLMYQLKAFSSHLRRMANGEQKYAHKPLYPHDPSYYWLNNELLNKYNRYGGGAADAFNRFIELSNTPIRSILEEPPIFQWIPFEAPADPINALSAKIDTIPEKPNKPIEIEPVAVGTPTLEGFASNNLILLLDVSSSMQTPEKLPLLKKSLTYLLNLTRAEDKISILTYSGNAQVLLPPTAANQKQKILAIIDNLKTNGSTNAKQGFELAYKTAQESFIPEGNNRIIVATDGQFDLDKKIYKTMDKQANKGIGLSVFYFAPVEISSIRVYLQSIAQRGKGNYSYIQKENAEKKLLIEAQSVRKK